MKAIASLPSLVHLLISFSESSFTDEMVKSMCTILRPLTKLLSLKLFFVSSEIITDEGIIAVSELLSQLINLKSFLLDMDNYNETGKVSDVGVLHLVSAIQTLRHFSSLNLSLYGHTTLSDESTERLAELLLARVSIVEVVVNLLSSNVTKDGDAKLKSVEEARYFQTFGIDG
eukprot:TRINITY_DN17452_c0_g1_i1.p2 TRINITY_DN17452_c0_g1~~TRINITY_DN17452_c0_g1_i1.p2  ORF type:complete len:173 (-),score=43.40 TRINITY_DN17452_c0_g1_i1:76-594(-)